MRGFPKENAIGSRILFSSEKMKLKWILLELEKRAVYREIGVGCEESVLQGIRPRPLADLEEEEDECLRSPHPQASREWD